MAPAGPFEAGGGAGGYQKPSNPAPVSGPGALSQRTDGGPSQPNRSLPNAKYGENRDFVAAESGAPMPQSNPLVSQALSAIQGPGGAGQKPVVPFNAPSQRPGEAITSGAASGAGPGQEALNLAPSTSKQDMVFLRPYLPVLEFMANAPGASPGLKQYVRYMKGGGIQE